MPECRWQMNKIQILKSRRHTIPIRFRGFRGNRRQQSPPSNFRFVKNAAKTSNQVQRTDFPRFHGKKNGDERWHVQIKYKCDVVVTKSGQNWIEKNGEAKHHRRYTGNSFKKGISKCNIVTFASFHHQHTHTSHTAHQTSCAAIFPMKYSNEFVVYSSRGNKIVKKERRKRTWKLSECARCGFHVSSNIERRSDSGIEREDCCEYFVGRRCRCCCGCRSCCIIMILYRFVESIIIMFRDGPQARRCCRM